MTICRTLTALVLASSVLATSAPAAAQESRPAAPRQEQEVAAKNIAMFSGFGVGAVGLGLALLFHGQANASYEDRRDIARANGSEGYVAWRCYGADECGRMRSLREDEESARTRWAASLGVALAGTAVGAVVLAYRLIDLSNVGKSGGGEDRVCSLLPV